MRSALLRGAIVAGLLAVAAPSVSAGDERGEVRWAELLTRLAQAPAEDRAAQCAECFADCENRYGKACSLLCHYASPCWSMCVDRRRECNQECNEALSCRARRRSCRVDRVLPASALP